MFIKTLAYLATIVCSIYFCCMLWDWLDCTWLEKKRLKHFKEGYQKAVHDILNRGSFIEPDGRRIRTISIASIDGKVTPYWDKKFDEYTDLGFNTSLDSFVETGVINEETAEEIRCMYEKRREGDKDDKD